MVSYINFLQQAFKSFSKHVRGSTDKIFKDNAQRFYRKLSAKIIKVEKTPNLPELENFCCNIWEEPKYYKKVEGNNEEKQKVWEDIIIEKVKYNIQKTSNWKEPGIDKVANLWIKSFTSLHEPMTKAIKKCLLNPELCPTWLTTGKTILIPKSEETNKPKNYRPITCLSTFYKIITSIIKNRIHHHLTSENMLSIEQKGCQKGSYGCEDQILINKAILEEAKKKIKFE